MLNCQWGGGRWLMWSNGETGNVEVGMGDGKMGNGEWEKNNLLLSTK